ncbi:ribokinase [Isoptericola variabilis J7]|uniref:ribokinase n=1 Tax=Isoptericola variabilis TaxID=139208 RepID=UPI0011A98954|nr:ribokinase [Isoptericola variabilis]TWH30051.1 ribokinase [Isoptericola variabilis J7]
MASIVVVGSVNADLVVRTAAHPAPGETVLGSSLEVLPGGKGANQAVAALVGAVGSDEFAEPATAGLRSAGVDLSGLAQVPGPTGIAIITVSDDGENTIVVVPGANGSVDADAVRRHAQLVAGADVVVLQGEIPPSGIEEAARLAHGRVVLNLAPVLELPDDVTRLADPLVVNEHEALRFLGIHEGEPHDVVRALVDAGPRSAVLTLGARGARVAERSGERTEVTAVAAPKVDVVDTTGAGDAFVGALAWRLSAGDPLAVAAGFAARAGAHAATLSGAQPSFPAESSTLPTA